MERHDIILTINGESTENLSLQQAVDKIRGPQGSSVKLSIQRQQQQLEISIVREKIVVPAITVNNQDGIEIIKIVQFGDTSAAEMKTELESIAKKHPSAIIIDLRNNPGGFLSEVATIVDYFIEKDHAIVYLKDKYVKHPFITEAIRVRWDPAVTALHRKISFVTEPIVLRQPDN